MWFHDIEAYSDRWLTCVVVPYDLFTHGPFQRDCYLLALTESMRTF